MTEEKIRTIHISAESAENALTRTQDLDLDLDLDLGRR